MFEHLDTRRFAGRPVGVLFGGRGPERDISMKTGRALADALEARGHEVIRYDLPHDLPTLVSEPCAAVLLGLHGDGEDGTVQGLCETLRIPYTGSGVLASALAMDKARAKAVMRQRGVPVAEDVLLLPDSLQDEAFAEILAQTAWATQMPYVLKPNDAGSSVGVHVITQSAQLPEALADLRRLWHDGQIGSALMEQFFDGAEYSVGFFGETCLGVIRIAPAKGFYDYHAKYEASDTSYEVVEDHALHTRLEDAARSAWRALGARGVGRVDIMGARGRDDLAVLEVNTIPGMTATSLVPKLAARRGIDFPEFCDLMLAAATTDAEHRGASHGEDPPP